MTSHERKQAKLEKARKRVAAKKAKKEASRRKWRSRFSRLVSLCSRTCSALVALIDRLGIRAKIQSSILAQILLNFLLALILGVVVTMISMNMSVEVRENYETSYVEGYIDIDYYSEILYQRVVSSESQDALSDLIKDSSRFSSLMSSPQIYITDISGNVLLKNAQATAEKLDIFDVFEKAASLNVLDTNGPSEVFRVFHLGEDMEQEKLLIYIASPRENIIYTTEIVGNGGIFPYLNGLIVFLSTFLVLSRHKMRLMTDISDAMLIIADGDLDFDLTESGSDEIALLAENVNHLRRTLKAEKEEQIRIEKTKSELITNVSHDLRTPLTSIMGYLGLIRSGQFQSEREMQEYAEIAYNKSESLKLLIDDLFEYTKCANSDISLDLESISMAQLLEQIAAEYLPLFEENDLALDLDVDESPAMMRVDAKKIVRVCENLLMNSIRYSTRPGSVKLSLENLETGAEVRFENMAEQMSPEDLENIFERMYKLDKSRSHKGSGLGLAIAKGIVEAHGGRVFVSQEEQLFRIGFFLPFA